MSAAPFEVSTALLNSPLVKSRPSRPEIMAGYEAGAIATRAARAFRAGNGPASRPFTSAFLHSARPRPQRSPDRERSIHRRRKLAATWPIPPNMAGHLTTSQLAYARIVADEVKRKGDCRLTLDEIAARGGMCRKTAKRAQDRLERGLRWIAVDHRPVQGRKHLSNVVRIVAVEWSTWIRMRPKATGIGGHSCPTTENRKIKTTDIEQGDRPKGALEGKCGARAAPNRRRRGAADG